MPQHQLQPGESFPVQFAWRLPDGGYLRAVFEANVVDLVPAAEKYVVRLSRLLAGRQEDQAGQALSSAELDRAYWSLVGRLIGRRVTVAYEVDDGRALHMRLETLTGEHNFFFRFDQAQRAAQAAAPKRPGRRRGKPGAAAAEESQ